jgi:hypothetical protein
LQNLLFKNWEFRAGADVCFEPHFQRTWYIGTQTSTIWRRMMRKRRTWVPIFQAMASTATVLLNSLLHIMYACNSMISSLTLHLCCHWRNILPCVYGWNVDDKWKWMNFLWTLEILFYFDEKLVKKKDGRKFMLVYFEKFNTWNVKVIFEIILYVNLIWIFAASKPYRI